jgi:hypothetical protein
LLDELRTGPQQDDIPVTAATRTESDQRHTQRPAGETVASTRGTQRS